MKIRTPYIVLFLMFVVLGVYYPSIFSSLNTVDDVGMANAHLNYDHVSLRNVFLPGGVGYYYRPLLSLTFIADNYFWGMQPSFMHLENILLHALNVVLVFFIAREICGRYKVSVSMLSLSAALIFALHPINTESINWISGRTDLLAGSFIFLSMFLLLRALETNSSFLCVLASFSFLISCFAKDSAIFFFPAAVLIIWHCNGGRHATLFGSLFASMKEKFIFHFSYISMVVAYFIVRHVAFAKADTGISAAAAGVIGSNAHVLYTLKVIVKLLGFYVKKLFFPWPLNFAIVNVSDYYVALGVIVLISIIYLLYRRELLTDMFLMSICIISPAFLVALNRMAWTPVAERYLYIPAATFSIGISLILFYLFKKCRIQQALPVLAVLLFTTTAYATVNRNIIWQDNLTLFQDTNNKSPDYPPVKNELAIALKEHGRKDEGDRLIRSNRMAKDARNVELCDLNRAALLCGDNDFKGARRLLLDNLNPSSSLYKSVLLKLTAIDVNMIEQSTDRKEKEQIRQELITMLKKLQENTGDPYFLYKIGQQYLFAGNKSEARNYFVKAFESSPEGAFYKLPAGKMAEKLKQ